MHKRRWAVVVAVVLVAGVAVAAALATTSRPAAGKTYYYIPKDTLNPYEVIADHGGNAFREPEIGPAAEYLEPVIGVHNGSFYPMTP